MAYKDAAHRLQVFQTPEYRAMVKEYIKAGSPVPLSVFQQNYGRAFFDRRGNPIKSGKTETSRTSFLNIMHWTDRIPDEVETWDEWMEFNDY